MIEKIIKKIKERKIKKLIEVLIIVLFTVSFLIGAIANIKILQDKSRDVEEQINIFCIKENEDIIHCYKYIDDNLSFWKTININEIRQNNSINISI